MPLQERTARQQAWAHKDIISWIFGVFSGPSGLISWLAHVKGGLSGLLAAIGVFGIGAAISFGLGLVAVAVLEAVEKTLKRKSHAVVPVAIIAAVMIAGGSWALNTYAHGRQPNQNFHWFVLCGIVTLLVPLVLVWHRYLSKPTEQKKSD
jgi:hypothetical protein